MILVENLLKTLKKNKISFFTFNVFFLNFFVITDDAIYLAPFLKAADMNLFPLLFFPLIVRGCKILGPPQNDKQGPLSADRIACLDPIL